MPQSRPTMPTMLDEFSFIGYWWLPEDSETRWAGQVTYKPESNIELIIMDEQKDLITWPYFPEKFDVLHGKSPQFPRDMTLLRSQWLEEPAGFLDSNNMTRMASARFRSEYLIAGHLFGSPENVVFESVNVSFSNLRGWMWSESPFSFKEEEDKFTLTLNPCPYQLEIDVPAICANLILCEVIREQNGSSELSPSECRYERDCFVTIKPYEPQSLNWYREQIDGLRDLFAFLIGRTVETKYITANCIETGSSNSEVEIFHFVRPSSTDIEHIGNMCFSRAHLGEARTQSVFQTWFDRKDNLWLPVSMCLDVNYNPRQSKEDKLVSLFRVFESLRQNMGIKDRDYLRNLKRQRDRLPNPLQEALGLDDTLLCKARNTRHFLEHFDSTNNPEDSRLHGVELADAIVRLVPCAVALLYKELGIGDVEINSVFSNMFKRGWWLYPHNNTE